LVLCTLPFPASAAPAAPPARFTSGGYQPPDLRTSGRILSVPCADGTTYTIRVWQSEDGLPQNTVTAITQTADGYLWLGTYDGLARFDGSRFTIFNSGNTPELQNSRISYLYEDPMGVLWIGHETGDLSRLAGGRFERIPVPGGRHREKVVGLNTDGQGYLWLMDQSGLLERQSDGQLFAPESPAGQAGGFAVLARGSLGGLWVARAGEVGWLQADRMEKQSFDNLTAGYSSGVAVSRDGGLWVVANGKVRKWRGRQWAEEWGNCPWNETALTTLVELENGTLAVGTLAKGLYLLQPDHKSLHFDHSSGLQQDWIRCLCEDHEGTLWVGMGSDGLASLRPARISTVNAPDRWQARPILSVHAATDGALWVGTEGAGLYRLYEGNWNRYTDQDGIANLFIWSLAEDSRGRIWTGTWGGGCFVHQNGKFEYPAGLEAVTVPMPAMLNSSSGDTVWVGTGTGLIRYRNSQVEWIGRPNQWVNPDIRALAEDRNGTLWVGMLGGGLGRYNHGELRQFRASDGLSSDFVQCLLPDTNGVLWIGTSDAGLNRMKDGRFATIGAAQGLPNNVICHIADDGLGYLWLGTHGGILRCSKADLNLCAEGRLAEVPFLAFNRSDGMPAVECAGGLQSSGCRTRDGRLWFNTPRGLVNVDPASISINLLPPPVVLEEMRVDDRDLLAGRAELGRPLTVDPGRHRFEFRYAGLSFAAPERVLFRYRLEGLESTWIPAGTKRSAFYGYLPPGHYTFHVAACNNDGVWSVAPVSVAFTVRPYFWQTWWFSSVAVVSVLSMSVLIVQLRARRRLRAQMEIAERKNAIERERSRIAQDIHDDLGASLTRITLLSQSARADLDDRAQAEEDIDRIYKTARELTRAMDEIVWAVNPRHDTLDSLATYLGKFAQDFVRAGGVRCRLDVPVSLPPWPMRAEIRHNLFLAFKEALNNAMRHAGATEVRVALVMAADGFTLTVEDNGKGAATPGSDPADSAVDRVSQGNGLDNMRRRLEEIGGRFYFESIAGEGTRVRFVVTVIPELQ
jgi:signal transduction histidine kinase/ligand-binding sensor domain-containing protein